MLPFFRKRGPLHVLELDFDAAVGPHREEQVLAELPDVRREERSSLSCPAPTKMRKATIFCPVEQPPGNPRLLLIPSFSDSVPRRDRRARGVPAGDKQPPPGLVGVNLIAGEEVRVICQELLQEVLRVISSFLHREQPGIFLQEIDATSHLLTLVEDQRLQRTALIAAALLPKRSSPSKKPETSLHERFARAAHFLKTTMFASRA